MKKLEKRKNLKKLMKLEKRLSRLYLIQKMMIYWMILLRQLRQFLPGRFPFGKGEDKIVKYKKFLDKLQITKLSFKNFSNLFLTTLKIEKDIFIETTEFIMIMIYLEVSDFKSENLKAKLQKSLWKKYS